MMKERKVRYYKWWAAGAVMAIWAFGLLIAARRVPGFAQWYGTRIYPNLASVWGGIWGLLPWSVSETGIYSLTVFLIFYLIRYFRQPMRILSRFWALGAILLLVYALNCGINYYKQPFSTYLDLEITGYTKEQLYDLCEFLTHQLNEAAGQMEAELLQNGLESKNGLPTPADWKQQRLWQKACVDAMESLGNTYPQLSGFYPSPKPVSVSWILSVQQLSGIYSPFTVEANYNRQMTSYAIPHTMCHELSHLKGFMREDEANFIGYLACIGSQDVSLRYSGYLTGWYYAVAALAKVDMEGYYEMWQLVHPMVQQDIRKDIVFWQQYEGKVAETATKVNNSYLKMNDQKEGIRTYGRMVDLMLAYFLAT